MFELDRERAEDLAEVEMLLDTSFAPGREALSSYRLRDGRPPERDLCRVARDEYGVVGGAIRYWRVRIGDARALLLGPIAVHPTRQGEGLGALLMVESLAAAAETGWRRVVLVGDLPYYRRFGFEPVADRVAFPPPTNPNRVLGKALVVDGFDGVAGTVRRWDDVGDD